MRLLHKVVKSSQSKTVGNAIDIDNTVVVKQKSYDELLNNGNISEGSEMSGSNIDAIILKEISIKKAQLERDFQSLKSQLYDDVQREKSQIISSAISEADKIRKSAEIDILVKEQKAVVEGQKEGYEKGYQDGEIKAKSELQAATDSVKLLLSEINDRKNELLVHYENEIVDMTVSMAEKVVRNELSINKEVIFNIIKQASKKFRNSDYLKISIPKGAVDETVLSDKEFLKTIVGNIKDVDFEFLDDVQEGTVVLDDGREIIDAGIPTQLELLKEIAENNKNKAIKDLE